MPFGCSQRFQQSRVQQAVWSSLTLSILSSLPASAECKICHLYGFKRELCLVFMHHDSGFLCDRVELPVFQQRRSWLSKHRSLWRLTVRQIPAPQSEPWAHTVTARQPHKIPKTCCPSLDLLTEAQRKWLNRWIPKNVRFYRCYAACLLSSSCPLLQSFNSITAVELSNYVEQMFLSENDVLHWHLTIYIDTMLVVVVFLYLYRVEADLLSPQFSPPFRVIAEARGGRMSQK